MLESIGNFIIKLLIVFLLILVLLDILNWFNVIHARPGDIFGSVASGDLSFLSQFSLDKVVWFIFDIYAFLRTVGLFLFGISGLGSIIYLMFAIFARVFLRGKMPFGFSLKLMAVSFFGFICSISDMIHQFVTTIF